MEPSDDPFQILFELRPNIPVILKGFVKGMPIDEIRSTVPHPEDFDEDMEIMGEVGLMSITPLDDNETPTMSSETATIWERKD